MKKVINISLVIIIVCCATFIGHKYYNYYKDDKFNSEMEELAPMINEVVLNNSNEALSNNEDLNSSDDNADSQPKEEVKGDIALENENELKSINSDYQMWLQVDNTEINYPVVQTIDNSYYLEHNFRKESNISGTIFVDYLNNIETDKNLVIYGHNMRNGTMFNNLNKYKDAQFFSSNNTINIVREGNVYKYEVFSVYVEKAKDLNHGITFATADDFLNYVAGVRGKSIYNRDIDISENDKLITLVTCSYEFTDARTIVVAVQSE